MLLKGCSTFQLTPKCSWWHDDDDDDDDDDDGSDDKDNDHHHEDKDCDHNDSNDHKHEQQRQRCQEALTMSMCGSMCERLQKWATAYSMRAPKIKLKQIPKYTSMALMKQLALGSDVRAPIIRVVMVSTVVTPGIHGDTGKLQVICSTTESVDNCPESFFIRTSALSVLNPTVWIGLWWGWL